MFLWGAEYLGWNVRWILGYQGGGELRLAFERGETDLYATANLITLRELIGRRTTKPIRKDTMLSEDALHA